MLTKDGISFSKIILAVGRSDLRKGIDGLATIVRLKYGLDPLEKDTLFLFCGTRKDRAKGLLWTGDRYVLEFMRLMDGFSVDPSVGPKRTVPPVDPKKKRKR